MKTAIKKALGILSIWFICQNAAKGQNWQYINEVSGCVGGSSIVFNGELYISDWYGSNGCSINNCTSDIAKFNGTSWTCVGNLIDSRVLTFAEYNGELYAGGDFILGNNSKASLIKLQNGNWVAVRNNIGYQTTVLCVFNNELYQVEQKNGNETILINKWNNIGWDSVLRLKSGPYAVEIKALAAYHNELYIGGEFQNICGVTSNNIIKYNGTNYSNVGGTGTPLCFSSVAHFFTFNNNLYTTGAFSSISGVAANEIARWDGTSWYPLGNGLTGIVNQPYSTEGVIYNLDSNIIVSDFFIDSNNVWSNRVMKWDGSSWNRISPVNHGGILSFTNFNNNLYACGNLSGKILMKYGSFTGIEENKPSTITHQFLFPNPSDGKLNFEPSNIASSAVIQIFNSIGEKILEQKTDMQNEINLSEFGKGFYNCMIIQNGQIISKEKLIVE